MRGWRRSYGGVRAQALEAGRPAWRAGPGRRPFRLREWLEREAVFSWLMLTPPLLFLLAFLGYPFCYGFYLSFVRRPLAQPATFVGLGNFVNLSHDPIFWQAVWDTFRFSAAAPVFKLCAGLALAALMRWNLLTKRFS